MPDLHRIERGQGEPTLLIHGSAVDHATWSVTLRDLREDLRMVAYDRRGPDPAGTSPTVAEHARDAREVLDAALGEPSLVIGSSFGAVVALELARRSPDRVKGLVLLEPPLPAGDLLRSVAYDFGCRYDQLIAEHGGEVAADLFLRTVLGDDAVERMPAQFHQQAVSFWRQIRADTAALAAYQVGYARLAREIQSSTLLLGGGRSAPHFRDALEALQRAIPRARLQILEAAGHMLHVDARRAFAHHVGAFAREIAT